jgi:hypothetical protein
MIQITSFAIVAGILWYLWSVLTEAGDNLVWAERHSDEEGYHRHFGDSGAESQRGLAGGGDQ